jgi:transcription termination/antitermination protein NusG
MSACVDEQSPWRDLPWHAIYVKSRHEKSVASALASRGYESFLPTYLKDRKDRKRSDLPLFPNYVFCRFRGNDKLPVMTAPGVFSIVSSTGLPASIPEAEIEGIRRMLESGLNPEPWPYVKEGQQVSLKSGPLRGLEGIVVSERHERWLVVSVNLLQRAVAVKVERQYIS